MEGSGEHQAGGRRLVATTVGRPRRSRVRWWRRIPAALLALVIVGGVTAAITGASSALPGLQFLPSGHWVFNSGLQAVFHVDGSTHGIDSATPLPGDPGSQVVQGDTSGYVVGSEKIIVFGKSGLAVQRTMRPVADEVPYAFEAAGGPYLVYRRAGKVVRLGDDQAVVDAGGPVSDPVVTGDGTLWLFRTDTGLLCELPRTGDRLSSCPAMAPKGHSGALTLLAGSPRFLDTTSARLHRFGASGIDQGVPLGVATAADWRPAATDVAGRLALLDPHAHQLHLLDPDRPTAAPVTVALPAGDYDGPAAGGAAVTVVDRGKHTVLTYDENGRERDRTVLPAGTGEPRLSRGEDNRVYVENGQGSDVVVVDKDGSLNSVPLTGAPVGGDKSDQSGAAAGPDQSAKEGPGGRAPQPPPPEVQPPRHEPDQRQQDQQRRDRERQQRERQQNQPVSAPEQNQPVVPASPPGAPPGVTASASSGAATVSWGGAATNGATVTGYRITWRSGSGGTGNRTVAGSARRSTVSGLTNGETYTFSVAANNKAGTGAAASAPPVTPVAAAAAPTVQAAIQSNGTATLIWSAPNLGGGTLVHYLLTATGMAQRTSTATSTTWAGFPTGKQITFTVRAVTRTAAGTTVTGAPGSTTATAPQQPQGPTVTITRGPHNCVDHRDEPTCAQMHVVLTGFAPNTQYTISPHSANPDYHAGDAHYTTDDNGTLSFNSFQYYWVGDEVWASTEANGRTIESNHMTWTAS